MLRGLLFGAAVLATIAAVLLTRTYLNGRERQLDAAAEAAYVDVLVTTADMEIGHVVTERTLAWQRWPRANLNPKYVTRSQKPDAQRSLIGAAARQPLFAGEPVTDAKLVKRDNASVLAVMLRDGYRAVTIKVDEAQGLGGLVKAGDQVDVLLAHTLKNSGEPDQQIAEVIVQGVRVLGVGQDIKTAEDKNKPAKSITIEVDSEQAEAITLGRSLGTLSLALRSAFAAPEKTVRSHSYTNQTDLSAAVRDRNNTTSKVLAATRRLEPGMFLGDADLTWQLLAEGADPREYFTADNAGSLRGALIIEAVGQGKPLTRLDLVRPNDSRFVPMALRKGFRADSVAIASNTAEGGFIGAGDYVDVVFTDGLDDQSQGTALRKRAWSETVASGVRVLSIETSIDPQTNLLKVGGTATLEATPRQVQEIALASNMGKLILTLRPADDDGSGPSASETPEPSFTVDTAMSRGLKALASRSESGDDGGQVVVYRGNARSSVALTR